MRLLDGALGLHVGDFLGGGVGIESIKDDAWDEVPKNAPIFLSRVRALREEIELGVLDLGSSFKFTSLELTQSPDLSRISLRLTEYLRKACPISVDKARRATPHAEVTPSEKSQLRGLNGSMNWPITQVMVAGSASLSIQSANVERAVVEYLLEANKTLRFLKADATVGLD